MSARFAILALSLSVNAVHAHITQKFPTPYVTGTDGASNPLAPSGSNFPCQLGTAGLPASGPTEVVIGEPFNITFGGLATHGGGMCQISILPGFEPSKTNADFRVIKTQYGCLTTTSGNLDNGAATPMTAVIPAGIEPGEYTQSWTWASKTTNELYMMCAPIKVVAGKAQKRSRIERRNLAVDKRTLTDLPPVWLANLGEVTGTCKVQPQQLVVEVPEPGSAVENLLPESASMFKAECNGNPAAGAAKTLPNPNPKPMPIAVDSPPALSTSAISSLRPSSVISSKPSTSVSIIPVSSSTATPPTFQSPIPPSTSTCHVEGSYLCLITSITVCKDGKWGAPLSLTEIPEGYKCL